MRHAQALSRVVGSLRRRDDVLGVILFGSGARGDETSQSDVDLLVLVGDHADRRELRRAIAESSAGTPLAEHVTPSFFTPTTLRRELAERPSFGVHLADEGVVMHRSSGFAEVEDALDERAVADAESLHRELAERLSVLSELARLDELNGEFLPTLSQLYVLARSVVILKLLARGVREYRWPRIFDAYAALRPELAGDLATLGDLRPYYEHVHGRTSMAADAQAVDRHVAERAIAALSAIAES